MTGQDAASRYFRAYLAEAPLAAAVWRSNEALALDPVDLPPPLLDLGCGFGEFARVFFADRSSPDYGLDIDRRELRRALPARAYRALLQGDARRLPLADASIASVIAISALEHVPDVAPTFTEVTRVLRPSGVLAFTVPLETLSRNLAGNALLSTIRARRAAGWYATTLHRQLTHVNVWPADHWTALVRDAGMRVERSTTFIGPGATRAFEALLPAAFASRLFRKAFGRRPPHPEPLVALAQGGLRRFIGGESADGSNLLVVARKPA
jgi:SAM-dependent methyltransferase